MNDLSPDTLVTITLKRSDFEDAVSDIYASHTEFCLTRDGCDCSARAERMTKALEMANKVEEAIECVAETFDLPLSLLLPQRGGGTIVAAGGWWPPSSVLDFTVEGLTPPRFTAVCDVCEISLPFATQEKRDEWARIHSLASHGGQIPMVTRQDLTVEEAHDLLGKAGFAEQDEQGVLVEPTTGLIDVRWATQEGTEDAT